ncbi:MAG: beta-1,6-N-acetylglucosaminyltransferase [Gordonia sp. (in: high G+C Gram-positive bacteria)]
MDVVAHIDAKSDQRPFVAAAAGGARFVTDRIDVRWGGFSQVRATLACLALAGDGYHRHSLMSGADVVLRPLDELIEIWSGDREYLRIDQALEDPVFAQWHKVARFHFPDRPRLTRWSGRIPRRVPTRIPLMQGSQWWSLTGAAVDHLMTTFDDDPRWLEWFRFSSCPDEYVIHSVLAASPFADALGDIAGPGGFTDPVRGQHFIDWPDVTATHPDPVREADLPRVLASGALVARKVGPDWTWREASR